MKRARVLLADDHEIFLESVKALLEQEFEVIKTVANGLSLVLEAEILLPDVIITDISMPILNGFEAARRILQKDPKLPIIFLTVHNDLALVEHGFSIGALGYVLKVKAGQELVPAIREVLSGKRYFSTRDRNKS